MTESNQVHSIARQHLHRPPMMLWLRCDNRLEKGWPDISYCLLGVTGMCEEKVIPATGRCPEHFTLEQLLWAEAWTAAGGRWHLLGKCGARWWLLTTVAARRWFEGGLAEPILDTVGKFPLREILLVLAPKELRCRL